MEKAVFREIFEFCKCLVKFLGRIQSWRCVGNLCCLDGLLRTLGTGAGVVAWLEDWLCWMVGISVTWLGEMWGKVTFASITLLSTCCPVCVSTLVCRVSMKGTESKTEGKEETSDRIVKGKIFSLKTISLEMYIFFCG